jgi:hypothetical protein
LQQSGGAAAADAARAIVPQWQTLVTHGLGPTRYSEMTRNLTALGRPMNNFTRVASS